MPPGIVQCHELQAPKQGFVGLCSFFGIEFPAEVGLADFGICKLPSVLGA